MVYTWKTPVARRIKADANAAGKQFEELEKTIGLTPKTVVEANREEGTPLHNEFEWNDAVAADNYREIQAGNLLRWICIETEAATSEDEPETVRAFYPTEESGGYENISVIIENTDKRAELLSNAMKEVNAFVKKYEMLSELKPIMRAVKRVTTILEKK